MRHIRDEILSHRFHLPQGSSHFVNAVHDGFELSHPLETIDPNREISFGDSANRIDDQVKLQELLMPERKADQRDQQTKEHRAKDDV
ncbi:hypothetical protein D3C81_1613050 [compost metagenome]